jgi:hypothetical protein
VTRPHDPSLITPLFDSDLAYRCGRPSHSGGLLVDRALATGRLLHVEEQHAFLHRKATWGPVLVWCFVWYLLGLSVPSRHERFAQELNFRLATSQTSMILRWPVRHPISHCWLVSTALVSLPSILQVSDRWHQLVAKTLHKKTLLYVILPRSFQCLFESLSGSTGHVVFTPSTKVEELLSFLQSEPAKLWFLQAVCLSSSLQYSSLAPGFNSTQTKLPCLPSMLAIPSVRLIKLQILARAQVTFSLTSSVDLLFLVTPRQNFPLAVKYVYFDSLQSIQGVELATSPFHNHAKPQYSCNCSFREAALSMFFTSWLRVHSKMFAYEALLRSDFWVYLAVLVAFEICPKS